MREKYIWGLLHVNEEGLLMMDTDGFDCLIITKKMAKEIKKIIDGYLEDKL